MNKSEIAETKLPCGCVCDPDEPKGPIFWNPFNKCVQCHKCGQSYFMERAIAESQQERKSKNAEPNNDNRGDRNLRSGDTSGDSELRNASSVELGDGEPSPPPNQCPKCTGSKGMALCDDIFHSPAGVRQTNDVPAGPASSRTPDWAEKWAKDFHDTYERAAPKFGYQTREESAVPWAEVPESNRKLMISVCAEVLCRFEKWRSGAAQEVSPRPEPVCPMCCKPVFTDGYEGDTRELKAALRAIVEAAYTASEMDTKCHICLPSNDYRHEEDCPILLAERILE